MPWIDLLGTTLRSCPDRRSMSWRWGSISLAFTTVEPWITTTLSAATAVRGNAAVARCAATARAQTVVRDAERMDTKDHSDPEPPHEHFKGCNDLYMQV